MAAYKVKNALQTQTFPSGFVRFFARENQDTLGNKPSYKLIRRLGVPFQTRKLSEERYYESMQTDTRLRRVIRVPCVNGLEPSGDVAVISGARQQYLVENVAEAVGAVPRCYDVTLIVNEKPYKLPEEDEECL